MPTRADNLVARFSCVLFLMSFLALIVCVAQRVPIAAWHWGVTLALGGICVRSWFAGRQQAAAFEAAYGRPGPERPAVKPPTYHEP